MTTILAIIGSAGVGKDTAAEYLSKVNGWNIIHSYTTRPIRDGETNGKEHIFVNDSAPNDTFAYTKYGNYEYWTTVSQFDKDNVNIYVIDEKGLDSMLDKANKLGWDVVTVNIFASKINRSMRNVSENRMERDNTRDDSNINYDWMIDNNGSIGQFYKQLENINVN